MRSILFTTRRMFCDLNQKNRHFLRKMMRVDHETSIHKKASKIDEQKMMDYVHDTPHEKIAYEMTKNSEYDKQLKSFIEKFNIKHKNKISLLDFSSYITDVGDLKDRPLKKQDIELIKQFQKRKIDERVNQMGLDITQKLKNTKQYKNMTEFERKLFTKTQNIPEIQQEDSLEGDNQDSKSGFVDEDSIINDQFFIQGPFRIKDTFQILLLNIRSNTKVTTLNRINSVKTLLFMGNGNGIISYAKGKGYTPSQSLARALFQLKKNIIAIPRDSRCTLPLAITKRFQDYWLYLRPKPGFNAHGHPLMAFMITLAGIDHCAFNVSHTEKNVYNVLKVFFKAITLNTTPQELAEREGFKVYRHQFIRPLTYVRTHASLTEQAKVRAWKNIKLKNPKSWTYYQC